MKSIFDQVSASCSRLTTRRYSTSFSLGIRFLDKSLQEPIYGIYGFVRYADEIVDSFHDYQQRYLLEKFSRDTFEAIEQGISLNPILNSFQKVVRQYGIQKETIQTFLDSMEMDLSDRTYDQDHYEQYILGSAEVVGVMCLRVFLKGDNNEFERLKPYAMKLGSAFQKINFLRDLNADYATLGRMYFPGVEMSSFNDVVKREIEADIEKDFAIGYEGIKMLPKEARFGVFVAYVYYYKLFRKIKAKSVAAIMQDRIRISNERKVALFFGSYVRHSFNLL